MEWGWIMYHKAICMYPSINCQLRPFYWGIHSLALPLCIFVLFDKLVWHLAFCNVILHLSRQPLADPYRYFPFLCVCCMASLCAITLCLFSHISPTRFCCQIDAVIKCCLRIGDWIQPAIASSLPPVVNVDKFDIWLAHASSLIEGGSAGTTIALLLPGICHNTICFVLLCLTA